MARRTQKAIQTFATCPRCKERVLTYTKIGEVVKRLSPHNDASGSECKMSGYFAAVAKWRR